VWVDCIDAASPWHNWAVEQLQLRSERAPLHVNLIIYAELLVPGPDVQALDELLDVYDVQRSGLPWSCAALAAKAFGLYKRRGGARLLPLPDFFIGAHAAVANLSVLTRDTAGYSTYFPRLSLLGP
jgi:predicted nucleic acid-binding protein